MSPDQPLYLDPLLMSHANAHKSDSSGNGVYDLWQSPRAFNGGCHLGHLAHVWGNLGQNYGMFDHIFINIKR